MAHHDDLNTVREAKCKRRRPVTREAKYGWPEILSTVFVSRIRGEIHAAYCMLIIIWLNWPCCLADTSSCISGASCAGGNFIRWKTLA